MILEKRNDTDRMLNYKSKAYQLQLKASFRKPAFYLISKTIIRNKSGRMKSKGGEKVMTWVMLTFFFLILAFVWLNLHRKYWNKYSF